MTNIFDLINKLPRDIINYKIKQFIPKKAFVFTNKENYILREYELLFHNISDINEVSNFKNEVNYLLKKLSKK